MPRRIRFWMLLAHERRALGLRCMAVNWGVWGEAGMATRFDASELQLLTERGMGSMRTEAGLQALGTLLQQTAPQWAVLPINWKKWTEQYPTFSAAPLLSKLTSQRHRNDTNDGGFRMQLMMRAPREREEVLVGYLADTFARVLGFSAAQIDSARPLTEYGIDSLMALEVRNSIESGIGVSVPMVRFLQGPSLNQLAAEVLSKLSEAGSVKHAALRVHDTSEYSLSLGQQALWFLHKYDPESAAYHVAFSARALPQLDMVAFTKVFHALIARHSALRTVFATTEDGKVIQRILSNGHFEINQRNAFEWDDVELKKEVMREYERPFDFERPLVRAAVFHRIDGDIILLTVHHLVFDAWSVAILFRDLRTLYSAETKGTHCALTPAPAEYLEFVEWQAAMTADPESGAPGRYWQQALAGPLPVLTLPKPRHRENSAPGSIRLVLGSPLAAELQDLARKHRATLFTILLSAFQVLLHNYSGQDDIIVGTPVSGRSDARWSETIGYFINMLPLRTDLSGNPSFREHLAQTRECVLAGLAHQDFPFSSMVDRLRLQRHTGRSPVFQALFNMLSTRSDDIGQLSTGADMDGVEFGLSKLYPYYISQQQGQFDVGLEITDVDGSLSGTLKYKGTEIDRSTAEAMAESYKLLLEGIVRNADAHISDLSDVVLLDGAEEIVI